MQSLSGCLRDVSTTGKTALRSCGSPRTFLVWRPMKIGFNLLMYSGHITAENFPIFAKLKATGFDGIEIPIFDTSDPSHFTKVGTEIKNNGLQCTAVTILPDEA